VRVVTAFALMVAGNLTVLARSVSQQATGASTPLCRCGSRGRLEPELQDVPQPPAANAGDYDSAVANLLTPVLYSLCRFTEARRVILDFSGAGEDFERLHELVASRLRRALGRGRCTTAAVGAPLRIEEAPNHEFVTERPDLAFVVERRAYGDVGRALVEAGLPAPRAGLEAGIRGP
jgi:hypothetical protein